MYKSCIQNKSGNVFGLKFRLLMGYHDLTLKEIAEKTDSAISTVGTWRNGKIPSSMSSLEKLAKLFGVSVAYILSDDMHSNDKHTGEAVKLLEDVENKIHSKSEDKMPDLYGDIIKHFEKFLRIAKDYNGGLEYTFLRLKKEFPLNLFDDLK